MFGFYKNIFLNIQQDGFVTYPNDARFSLDSLKSSFSKGVSSFESDFDRVACGLNTVFFDDDSDLRRSCQFIEDYIDCEHPVSMSALMVGIYHYFGIDDERLCQIAFGASVYADVPHELSYHNNAHFKKVVFHMARLIVAHNYIFSKTSSFLDVDKIGILLIAACIHDLGHCGTGNILDRQYAMAKIERRSFEIISPFLLSLGMTDSERDDLLTLLMATDVSPFGDPMSPAHQVRRLYDMHFGTEDHHACDDISPEFEVLKNREKLCAMALMLHEADIINSAALNYKTTVQESCSVSLEIGRKNALPEDTLLFLDKICDGHMMSSAAQFIGAKAMAEIRSRVMEDYKNGNISYL